MDAIVLEEEFETEPVAETTTVKIPPVFIPKGVDASEENVTAGDHTPHELEVKKGALDAKLKEKQSDASKLSSQFANPSIVQDSITSKAIVGLLAVVAGLCVVIVFLIISNRLVKFETFGAQGTNREDDQTSVTLKGKRSLERTTRFTSPRCQSTVPSSTIRGSSTLISLKWANE